MPPWNAQRPLDALSAMYKKVAVEVQPMGPDDVEKILNECCQVKNTSTRVGGFSPTQCFGSDPRAAASLMNEGWTDLGGLAGQTESTSIFALQNMARVEAKKAFVHLDTSKRIQRAMLRNARPITMTYSVGDLVSFRKDNNTGGKTQWSVVSRAIGHEGDRDVWVLCENVPVLVSVHNLRPASEAEALAKSVLEGHPIVPSEVIGDDQKFVDARSYLEEPEIPEDVSYEPSIAPGTPAPTIPEDVEVELEEEESPIVEEQGRSRAIPTRRQSVFPSNSRNVRQRTASTQLPVSDVNSETAPARIVEPETPSSAPIIPESSGSVGPLPWPMIQDSLDDLPLQIRQHFKRARERRNNAGTGRR